MLTPAELKQLGLTTMPPIQADLPYDDGKPMESERHKLQVELLIDALIPWLDQRADGYIGGNMFVYYSLAQVRNQDFRGPDFFAVLGVDRSYQPWRSRNANGLNRQKLRGCKFLKTCCKPGWQWLKFPKLPDFTGTGYKPFLRGDRVGTPLTLSRSLRVGQ